MENCVRAGGAVLDAERAGGRIPGAGESGRPRMFLYTETWAIREFHVSQEKGESTGGQTNLGSQARK